MSGKTGAGRTDDTVRHPTSMEAQAPILQEEGSGGGIERGIEERMFCLDVLKKKVWAVIYWKIMVHSFAYVR